MTPKEYLAIRNKIRVATFALKGVVYDAYKEAEASPLPENLRPANADDIKPGALIWYKHGGDNGYFWQVVGEPLYYGDDFKAYTAEDGCRYGLDDAWIEVEA